MRNFLNLILLVTFISCKVNVNRSMQKEEIIVYKNLDNTLLATHPKMFFSEDHLLFDISIKYLDRGYYSLMLDTLSTYGIKQKTYTNPRPTYVFIAKFKKSNDTIYTNSTLDEWWLIKNNKKLFIRDENQKTLKFLNRYSKFF